MRSLMILLFVLLVIASCNKTVTVNCSNPNLILAGPYADTTRYTIYSYVKGSDFGTLHDSTKVVLVSNVIDYRYFILTDNSYDWIVKPDTGAIRKNQEYCILPNNRKK